MKDGTELVQLVTVRNMTRALRFYTKTLGARLNMRGSGGMKNYWASIQLGGCQVWLVAPGKLEKRKLAYTTFVVTDIRSTVQELQRKKVKFERPDRVSSETRIEGPIAIERFGSAAYFKDSEGNLLMIWENPPGM